ncbi:response regulator receiver domain protein [Fulvimarina pelagi HTCC2506]|uniref:Response regulator receiver domain protein n=1 Tax=Fulvimarina pelagi HTCC2506 TaxID=314231 RepID=Q0G4N3_9HYPH|nr:response regulator [Fulvimarina pelagi]EAU43381.1 response regulator receiver domain protein [Fulvimarina pelagi HTCC2506]
MASILIAEDEQAVRHLVARALRMDGHDVSEAEDGAEALDLLDEAGGRFDLILSDIRMPAMTGIELAHEAARKWPKIKILLMTGYAEQKEAATELTAIVEDVLDKPFAIGEVRERVGETLAAAESKPNAERICA